MAHEPPQLGRSGKRRGQAPRQKIGHGVLAVRDAGATADDARRDTQGRQGGRRIRGVGGVGVLTRAESVHHVGDPEADGSASGTAARRPRSPRRSSSA